MRYRHTAQALLRPLIFIAGALALALFAQITVSHADPYGPAGASTLGDFVWHDANADGIKDGPEWGAEGIDGVLVNLYLDDGDYAFDPATQGGGDTYQGSMITGDNPNTGETEQGWYEFIVTANGNNYWVEIADSNFQPGGALEHYAYTGELGPYGYNGQEPRLALMPDVIMNYRDADFAYARTGIELVKTAGDAADGETEYIHAGDDVVYHYTVTNTGETYLSNIIVVDDNGTPSDPSDDFTACTIPGPLAPNASQSCTHTVSNVTADVTNTATATGNPTNSLGVDLPGNDVEDSDDAVVVLYGSLGDFVWWDLDEDGVQDADEPGLKGVTVTLKDASDAVVATTVTDDDGAYSFTDLEPGDYTVVFTLPGSDWSFSPQDQGGDDALDSDADPATGASPTITLASGEDNDTIDAGLVIPSSFTITKENTTDETDLTPGDPISFTITIENTGKTWLAVLPLKDAYNIDYLTYVDAVPVSDDNLDDGLINWSDLTVSLGHDLAPGDSISVIVNFTAKAATEPEPDHVTINTATAYDVLADPDGPDGPNGAIGPLPDQSDEAPVQILNPVNEPMDGFSATLSPGGVLVQWRSLSEANILGYNVLRRTKHSEFVQVNADFIFARYAGASQGADYSFIDPLSSSGQYIYALEIVRLDGGAERYGSAAVTVAPPSFLPKLSINR